MTFLNESLKIEFDQVGMLHHTIVNGQIKYVFDKKNNLFLKQSTKIQNAPIWFQNFFFHEFVVHNFKSGNKK